MCLFVVFILFFVNSLERMLEAYSLDDQINHKAAFISEHIPDDKKLVLIGHSIGKW